jgi:hypothetical protein
VACRPRTPCSSHTSHDEISASDSESDKSHYNNDVAAQTVDASIFPAVVPSISLLFVFLQLTRTRGALGKLRTCLLGGGKL